MRTYGFLYEEKLTYRKEIQVKTNLSEDELLNIIDRAETGSESAEDIIYKLMRNENIEITKGIDSDYSSPNDVEVEYFDHREIKEEME
ncbi:MAG TPA: hypothetical protein VLA13_11100 [Massilibacterium sp.]|nr:hypothetical protein [Massilibacterium sp.]